MNQKNSTIDLSNTFQPEIRQGKVAGKRFKKIRYRRNCFFNQSHLKSQKYMHENLKHKVEKHLAKTLKSIHTFR